MPTRAVAIINPTTGRTSVDVIGRHLRAVARDHSIDIELAITQHPGHATALAREAASRADVLVAVGGDGTVSDVITGALGADVRFGIVPTGSTNMVAKDLGIPRNLKQAARIALGCGRLRRLDVARAGATTCVHITGVGYDAEIMRRTPARWKRRVGWLAYLPPAISQLSYPAFTARLDVDGRTIRCRARMILFAVGASFIHPRFKVGEGIDRSDRQLDVCIYNPPSFPATLSCLGWIVLGRPGRSRWQRQVRGERVRVEADRPVAVEVDGDYIGEVPIEIEMIAEQVRVYVPREGNPQTGLR
jgi:diacylglycerol kinase family enzyme